MTKMRYPFVAVVAIALLLVGMGMDEPTEDDERAVIREKLIENASFTVTPLEDAALADVFHRRLYEVEIHLFPDHGHRSRSQELMVFETEEGLGQVFRPNTNEPLPYLTSLVDPEFRLNEETAPSFEQALRLLMPEDFFEEEDLDQPVIRAEADEWHFLTGTFFNNLKGFVVAVDSEGRVTDASYSLDLE